MEDTTSTESAEANWLHQYVDAAQKLEVRFPALHAAVSSEMLAEVREWKTAQYQLHSVCKHRTQNVVIAALYGPSGAGKSTLFQLLTKRIVPVGVLRPTTYACAAVVPQVLLDRGDVESLFPDWDVEHISLDADIDHRLREKDTPQNRLYVFGYDQPAEATTHVVLVDSPDFNTTCKENREKAGNLLKQANVVVFVTSGSAYADKDVVEQLSECCRHSAVLLFVITMKSHKDAVSIWRDVIRVESQGHRMPIAMTPSFNGNEVRPDGKALRDFLAESSVYYVPYKEDPTLADCQSVTDTANSFLSELFGVNGPDVILRSLRLSFEPFVRKCREHCDRAEEMRNEVDSKFAEIRDDIEEAARKVATQFPAGRFMELVNESVSTQSVLIWVGNSLMQHIVPKNPKRRRPSFVKPLLKVERSECDKQAEDLCERWRRRYEAECRDSGCLSAVRVSDARNRFSACDPPTPDSDANWEDAIKASLLDWNSNNPGLAIGLAGSRDLMWIVGGGLVVADLLVFGGLGSITVLMTGGGAAAIAAGEFFKLITKWKLEDVAKKAEEGWLAQRSQEISGHFQKELVAPLFKPWVDRIASLSKAELEHVRMICNDVDRLSQQQAKEVSHV